MLRLGISKFKSEIWINLMPKFWIIWIPPQMWIWREYPNGFTSPRHCYPRSSLHLNSKLNLHFKWNESVLVLTEASNWRNVRFCKLWLIHTSSWKHLEKLLWSKTNTDNTISQSLVSLKHCNLFVPKHPTCVSVCGHTVG